MSISELFQKDLIFDVNAATQEELFTKVGELLLEKGMVKPGYTKAVKEREKEFPTGLDLSVVGADVPNVAIPHTETEFCNAQKVVVVHTEADLTFRNMIAPDCELQVGYFFFILNDNKHGQTNILSSLMERFTKPNYMKALSKLTHADEIYQYIISNEGVQTI